MNKYPIFERNRILKKEMLGAVRDYAFSHARLEYQEYGTGIIRGCGVTAGTNEVIVGPGIVKYGASVCLLDEEARMPYMPHNQVQHLKLKININQSSRDFIVYETQFFLDTEEGRADNEFEICRFNLRKGAQLRCQYKDLADMETEYDTVNLLHASFSGLGGEALSPAITDYFAKAVLGSENSQHEDRAFAWLCLSQPGPVAPAVLSAYIRNRVGIKPDSVMGNEDIYHAMCSITGEICQNGVKAAGKTRERRTILVD